MKKVEQVEVMYIKQSTALIMAILCLLIGFGVGVVFMKMTSAPAVPPGTEETLAAVQNNEPTTPVSPQANHQETRIAELKELLATDQKNATAWADLGNCYFDMNQFDEAIAAYQKHLELNPSNADVWTDMGIMYRLSQRPDEALRCFDKAIAVLPAHEQSRFNKGIVLIFDVQKKEEGLAVWRELVKINPAAKAPNGQPLTELISEYAATPTKKN